MSIKVRMKSYSFWVSLASAILLVLKVIGQSLGFSVNENMYNDIFTALCGILVICGIIAPPVGKENSILPSDINQKALLNNINSNVEQTDTKSKEEIKNFEENKSDNLSDLENIVLDETLSNEATSNLTENDSLLISDTIIQNSEVQSPNNEVENLINLENNIETNENSESIQSNNELTLDSDIELQIDNEIQNNQEIETPIITQGFQKENFDGAFTPNQSVISDNEQTIQTNNTDLIMDIPNSTN